MRARKGCVQYSVFCIPGASLALTPKKASPQAQASEDASIRRARCCLSVGRAVCIHRLLLAYTFDGINHRLVSARGVGVLFCLQSQPAIGVSRGSELEAVRFTGFVILLILLRNSLRLRLATCECEQGDDQKYPHGNGPKFLETIALVSVADQQPSAFSSGENRGLRLSSPFPRRHSARFS